MKILVTGAAGFIGSNVSERLLLDGYYVIGIDNLNPYYDPRIKRNNLKILEKNRNFIFNKLSILDYQQLRKFFLDKKPEKVIHLAAKVGVRPSISNPFVYEEVNIRGTLNLLELSREFEVKNFLFGSSSSVYGVNKKVPFSEDDPVKNQISVYACTKRAGELLCNTYHNLYGLNATCLRLFTVYGPRGRPDMAVYKFTKLIDEGNEIEVYGKGNTKRDYTYVEDVVSGVIAALQKDCLFEIFNLGNNNPIELKYMISLIEKELGKKAKIKRMPMQSGDVPITYADISHSNKEIGYNPKTNIEEGIKKFVAWYKNQKS